MREPGFELKTIDARVLGASQVVGKTEVWIKVNVIGSNDGRRQVSLS